MHTLLRFLADYDMAMLRALARNRAVTLASNRQREAADQLAASLADPESVQAALNRLSPRARAALDRLVAAGGRMRAAHFSRHFGELRPIGPGRLEREAAWQNPASPAEELLYLGLIFRGFYQEEGGPGEFVFVPDELLPNLPEPVPPPPFSVDLVPDPAVPPERRVTLAHDLFVYLVYLQNHRVRTYADGRLGRRDAEGIQRRLGKPADRRLALVHQLADRLELVTRHGESLRLKSPAVKQWLTAPPSEQIKALQDAWRDDPTWNDLCHVPGLICDDSTGWLERHDPVATRKAILDLLAQCPPSEWWSCVSFVAAVKRAAPDFQRPDVDYESWYIRDSASGEYLSGFESWDRVEGALLTDLLTGPLNWLGVVHTAATPDGCICRLAALTSERTDPAPVIVRPDFTVEVPDLDRLYVRFQLERFAELEGDGSGRYRLTLRALHRALAGGLHIEQILAFLSQVAGQPVPVNVAGQLRLWAERLGQVRLEEVALLQTRNERVMKELNALPQTRSLIYRVLSPTSALVRKQHLARLQKALRELGYLPTEDEEDGRQTFSGNE